MNHNVSKVRMPVKKENEKNTVHFMVFLIFILMAYLITAVGLLLLAYLLYKLSLSEAAVNVGIIVIYAISTFLSAYVCGKRMKKRKFIWGLGIGSVYFLILLLMSLPGGDFGVSPGTNVFTTILICAGSGMLGGMLA